jgi:2-polyprenyl-3-methyl-5-hydroxy-6-metoxy-1,4-benzoquinol methylase
MNKSEKFWNRLSRNYDKPEAINEVSDYKSIKIIEKYLNINDIVLDFGCATGTIASSIADKVYKMYGIDISHKMIEIAKNRAVERKIENLFFTQSTIFDDRLKNDSFNIILTFSVLHVIEDTDKIINRIHNLLKQGGLFISLTPCIGEKNILKTLLLFVQNLGILPYIRCFKKNELEKIITINKFNIAESQSIDNNPLEHFIIARK